MKKLFSHFGNPHQVFNNDPNTKDPMEGFHNVFLGNKGRRTAWNKPTTKGDAVQRMGHSVHKLVSSEWATQGKLSAAELPLVDVRNQLVASIDIYDFRGEPIEVKTVSINEIYILREPKPEHKLQLIYYMQQLPSIEEGTILYIAREQPGVRKAFKVRKDGEFEAVGDAAVKYMHARHAQNQTAYSKQVALGPEQKMGFALERHLNDYETPQQLSQQYGKIVKESTRLRQQRFAQMRKGAFARAYDQAHSGIYEGYAVNDGFVQGIGKSLRHMLTGFGSPYQGKKGKLTPELVQSKIASGVQLKGPVDAKTYLKALDAAIASQETIPSRKSFADYINDFHSFATQEQRDAFQKAASVQNKKDLLSRFYREDLFGLRRSQLGIAFTSHKDIDVSMEQYLKKYIGEEGYSAFAEKYKTQLDRRVALAKVLTNDRQGVKLRDILQFGVEDGRLRGDALLKLRNEDPRPRAVKRLPLQPLEDQAGRYLDSIAELQHDKLPAPKPTNDPTKSKIAQNKHKLEQYYERARNRLLDVKRGQLPIRDPRKIITDLLDQGEFTDALKTFRTQWLGDELKGSEYIAAQMRNIARHENIAISNQQTQAFINASEQSKFRLAEFIKQDTSFTLRNMKKLLGIDIDLSQVPSTGAVPYNLSDWEKYKEQVYQKRIPASQEAFAGAAAGSLEVKKAALPPTPGPTPRHVPRVDPRLSAPSAESPNRIARSFFDIESGYSPRSHQASMKYIWEASFHDVTAGEMDKMLKGPGPVDRAAVRQVQKSTTSRITSFRAKFLDPEVAVSVYKQLDQGAKVGDLVAQGHLSKADAKFLQGMFFRQKDTVHQVLKSKTNLDQFVKMRMFDYLQQIGKFNEERYIFEPGAAGNQLHASIEEKMKGATVSKSVGAFFRDQSRITEGILDHAIKVQEAGGDIAGHNIIAHDINEISELSRAFNHETKYNRLQRSSQVVDTMIGPSADNFKQAAKQELQRRGYSGNQLAAAIENAFGSKETFVKLTNMTQLFGYEQLQGSKLEHRSFYDAMMNIAVDAHQTKAHPDDIALFVDNLIKMQAGENPHFVVAGATAADFPKMEHLAVGKVNEYQSGMPREFIAEPIPQMAKPKAISVKRLKSFAKSFAESEAAASTQLLNIAKEEAVYAGDALVNLGRDITHGFQKAAQSAMPGLHANRPSKFSGLRTLGLLGVVAAAGVGIAGLALAPSKSTTTIGWAPRQNLTNKAVPREGTDDNHTMRYYTGPQAQELRHRLTDFGSGYQGRVGSGLAKLMTDMSRRNLSRTMARHSKPMLEMPSSSLSAEAKQAVLHPIESVHSNVMPMKRPAEPMEVVYRAHSRTHADHSNSKHMMELEIKTIQDKISRQKQWANMQSGTRTVFMMNHHRSGHHRVVR